MEEHGRNDRRLILGFLLFAVCLLAITALLRGKDPGKEAEMRALIQIDGKKAAELSLGDGRLLFLEETLGSLDEETGELVFRMEGDEGGKTGENRFQVKDGRIACIYADCPDGICRKTGWICRETDTIVCLPHRLIVTILRQQETD